MAYIYNFPSIADGLYIGALEQLELQTFKKEIQPLKLKAIYIAPASHFPRAEAVATIADLNIQIHPFGGGFMQNSLILFSFDTLEDREYFTKITTLKTTGVKDTLRLLEIDCNDDPLE
jgi:hypothetical protein